MPDRTGTVRTTRRRRRPIDERDDLGPLAPLTDALPRLAGALEEAAEDAGWGHPPSIVRVTAWPSSPSDGFDLGIRPIDDGANVVETLALFVAPADWLAIGVVTEGNAHHLDERRGANESDARRVRCVHLVDRSGASASVLRLQGEEATALHGHDPEGRIDDACRRALGLPTRPPSRSTLELWALVWLDRLASRLSAGERAAPVRWPDVAALHPAVALVVAEEPNRGDEAGGRIVRLAEILADVNGWSALRAACASGEWPVNDVPPPVAAWLDDGAFSRWVLGACPDVALLADAVGAQLPSSVARRLRAALRSWHLDGGR